MVHLFNRRKNTRFTGELWEFPVRVATRPQERRQRAGRPQNHPTAERRATAQRRRFRAVFQTRTSLHSTARVNRFATPYGDTG